MSHIWKLLSCKQAGLVQKWELSLPNSTTASAWLLVGGIFLCKIEHKEGAICHWVRFLYFFLLTNSLPLNWKWVVHNSPASPRLKLSVSKMVWWCWQRTMAWLRAAACSIPPGTIQVWRCIVSLPSCNTQLCSSCFCISRCCLILFDFGLVQQQQKLCNFISCLGAWLGCGFCARMGAVLSLVQETPVSEPASLGMGLRKHVHTHSSLHC